MSGNSWKEQRKSEHKTEEKPGGGVTFVRVAFPTLNTCWSNILIRQHTNMNLKVLCTAWTQAIRGNSVELWGRIHTSKIYQAPHITAGSKKRPDQLTRRSSWLKVLYCVTPPIAAQLCSVNQRLNNSRYKTTSCVIRMVHQSNKSCELGIWGRPNKVLDPNLVTRNAGSVTMSGPTRTSETEWRTTLRRQVLSLRRDKTNPKINNLNYNKDFLKLGNTSRRLKLLTHDWGSNKGYVLVQWRWWLSSSSEPYEASAWYLAASSCKSHRENYIHTRVICPVNKQQVHEMTYLQNEEAVTFSVRDRFCLVGMRPILYLMWKNCNNNRLIKCRQNKVRNENMKHQP